MRISSVVTRRSSRRPSSWSARSTAAAQGTCPNAEIGGREIELGAANAARNGGFKRSERTVAHLGRPSGLRAMDGGPET